MKRTFRNTLIAAAICLCGQIASAQSLKGLLQKATSNETVKSVVENVTGTTGTADITGTWTYSGTAVKFESEGVLKNAAASVAATQVEKKLDEFVGKAGLKAGTFSFTFSANNSFSAKVLGKTFNGTYTLNKETHVLSIKFGNMFGGKAFISTVSASASQLDMLFSADKLLELIGNLTEKSEDATLKSIGTLAKQYNGMKLGLELKK